MTKKEHPKGSTQNINNPIKKTICWEEQLKMMLKHKALQKRITTKRIKKCWEEENQSEEKKNVRTIKMIPWKGAGSEDQLHGLINNNQKERLKRTDTNNMKA